MKSYLIILPTKLTNESNSNQTQTQLKVLNKGKGNRNRNRNRKMGWEKKVTKEGNGEKLGGGCWWL